MSEPLRRSNYVVADVACTTLTSHFRPDLPLQPGRSRDVPDFPRDIVGSDSSRDRIQASGLFDDFPETNRRPLTDSLIVHPDSVSHTREKSRPRSAPVSWMSAITTSVNSLWRAFYGKGTSAPVPALTVTEQNCNEDPICSTETLPYQRQGAQDRYVASGLQESQPTDRQVW